MLPILVVGVPCYVDGLPYKTKYPPVNICEKDIRGYNELTSTMCPVEISMLVKAGSSLHEEVLDLDDGGFSLSFANVVIRPLSAVVPLPAILARHNS